MDMTDADYIASLERELAKARDEMNQQERKLRKQLDRELGCELRDPYGTIWEQCQAQDKELADLRRDRERLDFVLALRSTDEGVLEDGTRIGLCHYSHCTYEDREQIDAAMGESKGGEQ